MSIENVKFHTYIMGNLFYSTSDDSTNTISDSFSKSCKIICQTTSSDYPNN